MCTHSMLVPAGPQQALQQQIEQLAPSDACYSSEPQGKISSKYRGLCWDKKHRAWRVRIFYGGKQRHVGRFKDDVTAARAYDKAAVHLYGAKAILNFSMEECLADPTEVSGFITLAKEQAIAAGLEEHHPLLRASGRRMLGQLAQQSQQQQQLGHLQAGRPHTAHDLLRLMQQQPESPAGSSHQYSPVPAGSPVGAPLALQQLQEQQQWQAQQWQAQQWQAQQWQTQQWQAQQWQAQQWQAQQQQQPQQILLQQQQQQAASFLPAPFQPTQQLHTACGSGASSPNGMFSSRSCHADGMLSTSDGMPAHLMAVSSSSSNTSFLAALDGQQAVLLPAASAAPAAAPSSQHCLAAASHAGGGYTTYQLSIPASSACLAPGSTVVLQQAVPGIGSPSSAGMAALQQQRPQLVAGTATSSGLCSSPMTMLPMTVQAVSQPMTLQQVQLLPSAASFAAGLQQQRPSPPPQQQQLLLTSSGLLVSMLDNECHIGQQQCQQWM